MPLWDRFKKVFNGGHNESSTNTKVGSKRLRGRHRKEARRRGFLLRRQMSDYSLIEAHKQAASGSFDGDPYFLALDSSKLRNNDRNKAGAAAGVSKSNPNTPSKPSYSPPPNHHHQPHNQKHPIRERLPQFRRAAEEHDDIPAFPTKNSTTATLPFDLRRTSPSYKNGPPSASIISSLSSSNKTGQSFFGHTFNHFNQQQPSAAPSHLHRSSSHSSLSSYDEFEGDSSHHESSMRQYMSASWNAGGSGGGGGGGSTGRSQPLNRSFYVQSSLLTSLKRKSRSARLSISQYFGGGGHHNRSIKNLWWNSSSNGVGGNENRYEEEGRSRTKSVIVSILESSFAFRLANALPSKVKQNVSPWDHWEIVGELGDGAFGKVHKARDKRQSNKLAAVKSIEIEAEEDTEDFLVEIEILYECQHRNIVGLHEAYLYGRNLYEKTTDSLCIMLQILLEFCAGGAVDQIMVELKKPLTEPQIKFIVHEVTEALRFLHSCNVIHRDLKAGNILLTADGDVKLGSHIWWLSFLLEVDTSACEVSILYQSKSLKISI